MKSPTYSLHFVQLFHIHFAGNRKSSSNEVRITNWVFLFDFFFANLFREHYTETKIFESRQEEQEMSGNVC